MNKETRKNSKTKTKKSSVGAKIAVGAGAFAVGAALYMLFGPHGRKNRRKVKSWAVAMEKDIVKGLTQMKDFSEPVYHEIVDNIKAKYGAMKHIDKEELESVLADLRKHWLAILKREKRGAPKKKGAKSVGSAKKK